MTNCLQYADDIALIANSRENLHKLLNIEITESEKAGPKFNVKKTEVLIITKSNLAPTCNISIFQSRSEHADILNYLGTMIMKMADVEKKKVKDCTTNASNQ